jgi:hypothetical protein
LALGNHQDIPSKSERHLAVEIATFLGIFNRDGGMFLYK